MNKLRLFSSILAMLFVLAATTLVAQEFRATITGTVTDPQGAVIPGAGIEVKNLETAALTVAKTNESGIYVAPFLPPGSYGISVTAAGFKRAVRQSVELRVGDRLQLDFRLEVGALAEQVTITASAELLETTTASKGQVIDSAKVANLPLLGRNPFMLAAVSTGVQYAPALASRSNRPFDNGGMDSFSVNGGRQFTNEFLLDGVPDTNTETTQPSNLSFVPSPDATEEFKVQTNSYDAQYGRTGGGVINVSLKSGTNRLHGALYDYFRHDKLNANPFEANLAGTGRAKFRWSQPGLQFNGPVLIPKLYDGRNRTFFMFSWEKIKSAIPFPQTYTVPTAEQREGDFSRTLQANGQPITIYDPLTTTQSGSTFSRTAFPGNRIPSQRINPVASKILSVIPKPNAAGNAQGFFNLIASPNPRTDEYDQFVGRVDQVIGQKHRFFSRYVRGNRHEVNSDAGYPHEAAPWYTHWRINQGGNFDLTSTFSPTLVVGSRVGFIRHQFAIGQFGSGFDATRLGFPASLTSQLPVQFFPRITYTDYTQFGPGRSIGNELTFSDTWSWSETVNKVVGRHVLKFGTEFRVMRNNQQLPSSSLGDFAFTRAFTQRNPLTGDAGSGNAFASLLLGYPASGSIPINADPAYQNRYYVLFVQDDWRVTQKLTLNLGLRWDYDSPLSERFDRQNAGFDAGAASPFRVPGLQLKGGILFTDQNKRLPFARDLNNFQPRVGVAYQATARTVIRGGYGISYLPTFDTGFNNGFSVSTPLVASVDGGLTPAGNLNNPYPAGIVRPDGRAQGLSTLVGRGFSFGFADRSIPYVHQYSLGFQHELPWRVLVDASYVGSLSRGLQTSKGINEVSAADLARGNTYLLEQVANPFQGLLPGTAFNGATVPRQQLLRPFPQFTGITQDRHTIGKSWYDSFQLRVEKRLSHGLHLLGSYTFSKSIEATGYLNPQDNFGALAKVLTAVDAPHRFVISGGWALPFGRGSKGLTRALIGGWTMNGIAIFQSGLAIGTPGTAYTSGIDPNLPEGTQSRNRWFNTCTINTNGARQNCASASEPVAWFVQPANTLRTLSTRFPNLRTKRPGQLDFSIFKTFYVTETVHVQFRAESFNLTNTPWFGAPATGINASNFGVVSPSQANDPRNVQLALRLTF